MDTSEKYIKMCKAAAEIQAMRAPDKDGEYARFEHGDFFTAFGKHWIDKEPYRHIEVYGTIDNRPSRHEMPSPHNTVSLPGFEEGDEYDTEKIIWLPRLDQLIDLIAAEKLLFLIVNNEKALSVLDHLIKPKDKSSEMLWLELFMYYVHKKSWNGEKWS